MTDQPYALDLLNSYAANWLKRTLLARGAKEYDDMPPVNRVVERILGACSDPRPELVAFILSAAPQHRLDEKTFLQQLFLLRQDMESCPALDAFSAQMVARWSARLGDLVNRRLAEPKAGT